MRRENIDKELAFISRYMGEETVKIVVIISSPKPITKEWRFVIVDGCMVTMEIDTFANFSGLGFHKTDKKRRSKKAWKWNKKSLN